MAVFCEEEQEAKRVFLEGVGISEQSHPGYFKNGMNLPLNNLINGMFDAAGIREEDTCLYVPSKFVLQNPVPFKNQGLKIIQAAVEKLKPHVEQLLNGNQPINMPAPKTVEQLQATSNGTNREL